jgi:hypothetical protein
MRMGRSEALDLFAKWRTDGALLRCQASFFMYAFSFRVKVIHVSPNEVRLASPNVQTELVLKITDKLIFEYLDDRSVSGQEAKDYVCCLAVFYTEPTEDEDGETIAFAEVKL